jgi:hypothetical protein
MLHPDPKKDDLAPPLRGEFELLKTRYSPTMNASSTQRDGFTVKLAALDEQVHALEAGASLLREREKVMS